MQRVTISLDEDLARAFDDLVAEQSYSSRSEAMRDLVRQAVDAGRLQSPGDDICVANFSYVFDHHTRDLARRLTDMQHHQHDLVISSTHVHLDHESCLESTMLKGPVTAIRALCNSIKAQRGVRFAAMNLVSLEEAAVHHAHTHD